MGVIQMSDTLTMMVHRLVLYLVRINVKINSSCHRNFIKIYGVLRVMEKNMGTAGEIFNAGEA